MSSQTPITPPGWYDDGHGRLRWWDGVRWTEHTAPLHPEPAAPQPTAPPVAQQVAPPTSSAAAAPAAAAYTATTAAPKKRSVLPWVLPVVLLVAAIVGGLLGAAVGSASKPGPLIDSFDTLQRAEATRDCALFEQVTTADFRDDATPGEVYSCEAWSRQAPTRLDDDRDVLWGMRFGPAGVLVVEEERDDVTVLQTYTFLRENGQWRVDEVDTE